MNKFSKVLFSSSNNEYIFLFLQSPRVARQKYTFFTSLPLPFLLFTYEREDLNSFRILDVFRVGKYP